MSERIYPRLAKLDAAVPEWLRNVRPGDVLRTPTGTLRVVRRVRYKRGIVSSCCFTIRYCSWTGACWTIKERSELFQWQPTGKRVRLTKRIDRAILADIGLPGPKRALTCCSVEGVS